MTFVEVDRIPVEEKSKHTRQRKDITSMLEEFLNMRTKYARVNFTSAEFNGASQAGMILRRACKNAELPIDVEMCGGNVYLTRRDM